MACFVFVFRVGFLFLGELNFIFIWLTAASASLENIIPLFFVQFCDS